MSIALGVPGAPGVKARRSRWSRRANGACWSMIERHINKRLKPARLPTQADIAARRREQFKDSILRVIDEGSLDAYLRWSMS